MTNTATLRRLALAAQKCYKDHGDPAHGFIAHVESEITTNASGIQRSVLEKEGLIRGYVQGTNRAYVRL